MTRQSKRLIILCDGTWQQMTASSTRAGKPQTATEGGWYSNVALLLLAIRSGASESQLESKKKKGKEIEDESSEKSEWKREIESAMEQDDKLQIVFYQSNGDIQKVTGEGLYVDVIEAYTWLSANYSPGDEIFLFGFSKGSYIARSIAGFINWGGILPPRLILNVSEIFDAYKLRKPGNAKSIKEASEIYYRSTGLLPSLDASQTSGIDDREIAVGSSNEIEVNRFNMEAEDGRVVPPPIKFIGCFDTVGALGVPRRFLSSKFQDFFSFHDPGLAPNVDTAIHALSLSEDRHDFLPTMWYMPEGRQAQRLEMKRDPQVLRQVWFHGAHSDIGGSYPLHGLSDITLAFMVSNLLEPVDDKGVPIPGAKPLLRIDLDQLKESQDRRSEWAKQQAHSSRSWLDKKAVRQVGAATVKQNQVNDVVWKNQIQGGDTKESIHHSVVVSGQYKKESKQFETLLSTYSRLSPLSRKTKFDDLWDAASNPSSLGRIERFLRWDSAEPNQDCPSGSESPLLSRAVPTIGSHSDPSTNRPDSSGFISNTINRFLNLIL